MGIGKKDWTRHAHMHGRTDAHGGTDEWKNRGAGMRGAATMSAATDQQEVEAPKMTGAAERLGSNEDVETRGEGRTTGENADAARETAIRTAAEGKAAENTENSGKINAPERQVSTHQEGKSGVDISTSISKNSSDMSSGESRGVMMRAQRAKMGIKRNGDDRSTRRADGDGKSRGDR